MDPLTGRIVLGSNRYGKAENRVVRIFRDTVRHEIRQPQSRIIGSTAFMPELYGEKLLELALQILDGRPVPPAVYMEPVFIDAGNIDDYYPG